MASEFEIRRYDRERLYELMLIKKLNDKHGTIVLGLDEAIHRLKTYMHQDDVKVVQQMISEYEM